MTLQEQIEALGFDGVEVVTVPIGVGVTAYLRGVKYRKAVRFPVPASVLVKQFAKEAA